jgi:hypothetical protein
MFPFCTRSDRDSHKSYLLLLGLTALVALGLLNQTAQAFTLSVYGAGGYDLVSSAPADDQASTIVPPEPSGPSYGLGLKAELGPFGPAGVAAQLGLSGFRVTWESTDGDKEPGGIIISSIGINGGLDLNLYFNQFVVGGGGSLHYGLSDTYDIIRNSPPQTDSNAVTSMIRFEGHLGVGYRVADFTIMGQVGAAVYTISLTTPGSTQEVEDVYTGFTFGLVASYAVLRPEPERKVSPRKEIRKRRGEADKQPKKKKKRPRPKKKR